VSDASETRVPDDVPDDVRGEAFRAKRRGRNLALLAVLAAFVLIVYIVTIVKFELASG